MTRPSKPKKAPKSTVIALRVSIEQREAIEKIAVTEGTTVSAYIATLVAEAVPGKPNPVAVNNQSEAPPLLRLADPAPLAELRRIGVNINQIAHRLNIGAPPELTATAHAYRELFDLLTDPDAFMKRLAAVDRPTVPSPERKPDPQPQAVPPATPKIAEAPPAAPPEPERPSHPRLQPFAGATQRPSPVFVRPLRNELPEPPAPAPEPPKTETAEESGYDNSDWSDGDAASDWFNTDVGQPTPQPPSQQSSGPQPPPLPRPYPPPGFAEPPHGDPEAPSVPLAWDHPARTPPFGDYGAPPRGPNAYPPVPQTGWPSAPPGFDQARQFPKEVNDGSESPQTRHQLPDRDRLRPARSAKDEQRPGILGALDKLWKR